MTMPQALSADSALAADLTLSPAFVRRVVDALDRGAAHEVKADVLAMHAADQADLFGLLKPDERIALLEAIGDDLDPEVLSELDETVRDEIVDALPADRLAAAVAELDSDDAAYVLGDLEHDQRLAVLAQVSAEDRAKLEATLTYPEASAGRLMQSEFVAVPSAWSVGQVIDFMRESDTLPDDFYDIYVLDGDGKPIGAVPVAKLLRTKRPVPIEEIMERDFRIIPATMPDTEAAYVFEHYKIVSAAVTDAAGRLAGQLTLDDVVEVMREQSTAQILALGGVSDDSDLKDPVIKTTRLRFTWLFLNLLTAILASAVIGVFEHAIAQVVALAVLMPIVASMGGNAGTQTLTVAVRALATKELSAANALRIVWKETVVGGLNGFIFAILMGLLAALWFADPMLGVVIGVAMVINLLAAGVSGVVIPLALHRMKIDPAVASAVFLTTVTDVVGFFTFLGLGAWLLVK